MALFLKGLARRISIHFNSVPVRQRACQAWSRGRVSARRRSSTRYAGHSTAGRESVFHAVSLCVISVCAHTVDRRVSRRAFVIRLTIPAHASDARGIPLRPIRPHRTSASRPTQWRSNAPGAEVL